MTEDSFRKWATSNDNVLGHVTTAEDFSQTDTIVPSAKVDATTATSVDEDVEKLIGLTTFGVENNATSSCLPGYICLVNVLRSTTPELFGSCWRKPIVGFGSFLWSWRRRRILLSRKTFSLKTDISVLRQFNQDEGHDSVPRLIRCGLYSLHLGWSHNELGTQGRSHSLVAQVVRGTLMQLG